MSTIPTYQKINAFMESAKPSVYTKSNGEGLERVKKEDGMYAYFMEAASIEYNVERYKFQFLQFLLKSVLKDIVS